MQDINASKKDWQFRADKGLTPFVVTNYKTLIENQKRHVWHGIDNAVAGSSELMLPVIKAPETGELAINFEHLYLFEEGGWDAGVIEADESSSSSS